LEIQNIELQAQLQASKRAIKENKRAFYTVQLERDNYKLNFDTAKFLLAKHEIAYSNPLFEKNVNNYSGIWSFQGKKFLYILYLKLWNYFILFF
jgi:hypothetical protein